MLKEQLENNISIRTQASLLGVNRSQIYYNKREHDDTEVANLIVDIYSNSDSRYGYRKVHMELANHGFVINKKKVQRIMSELNFYGLYPKRKFNISISNKEHKIYPYLLSNLEITHVNQVWATDITYIKIQDRFMYMIAIIDLYSRYIVEYGLSGSLEEEFYTYILSEALKKESPLIFNTDQGSQFTSASFIAVLVNHEIKISMDHKGRCFDNIYVERLWRTIKQEAINYYKPENLCELETVIKNYVQWYNNERVHQSLNYQKPADVYFSQNREEFKIH